MNNARAKKSREKKKKYYDELEKQLEKVIKENEMLKKKLAKYEKASQK